MSDRRPAELPPGPWQVAYKASGKPHALVDSRSWAVLWAEEEEDGCNPSLVASPGVLRAVEMLPRLVEMARWIFDLEDDIGGIPEQFLPLRRLIGESSPEEPTPHHPGE